MANCVKCGADNPIGATKCVYCGAPIDIQKRYPADGTEMAGEQFTAPISAPRFKRASVGLMVLFATFTFGLYLSVWFYARRKEFAQLSPKAKSAPYLFSVLLGVNIIYLLGIISFFRSIDASQFLLGNMNSNLLIAVQLLGYAFMGVMVYSAIIARAALMEYASRVQSPKFADSIVWTVFLNAIYLQSSINGMLDTRVLDEAL